MRKASTTKPRKASKSRLAAAAGKRPAKAGAKAKARVRKPASNQPASARPAQVELAAECTLRDAAALQALLIGAVSGADHVILEGGAVERIDAAALQLLAAFARREQAAGRRLVWQSASDALRQSSAWLGLTDTLGLEVAAGAAA